ncbi:MAG: amidohydrolase family protein [Gemmatimonadota bacterium]
MLIDINTWIGHWPFRQLRDNTAGGLVRRLDDAGIDRAVVANLNSVFYKSPHAGNEELARDTRRRRDRLLPFASLNPRYPGWREDLRRCAEDLGLCGLRLYPQYQQYALTDPEALELVDAAAALGWAVQVPMRIVDRRQRHHLDLAADLTPADLQAAVAARPKVKWMFLNALGVDGARLGPGATWLLDISRLTALLQRNIQALIAAAGAGHLAFGTGLAFKVPEPALVKLEVLDQPRLVKERIAWRNAAKLLGL